jgi:integrase
MPTFNSDNVSMLVIEKQFIKSQTTIRAIFKESFIGNSLPYRKPHSFRHSVTRKMMRSEKSSLFISAFAQNMGQKDVGVIISSYGTCPDHERASILKSFRLE